MAKRRSVSIRATLGLLIVFLGSLLVGESAVGVITSWRRVAAATRLVTLSEVDEKLFAVLTAARMARSTMLAVLAGTTPIDPAGAARVAATRSDVDVNFQQAKARLAKPGQTMASASLTNLQAAYDAELALRPQLSAAVRLPGYARDQNLVRTAQQILRSFVDAITAASDAVEQDMLLEDPAFGALLRIKQAAFDMRVAVGTGFILMNIAAGAERSWTGKEIAAFADSQTSRDLAWARLAEAKARPETPPQLVAAIGQIERYYDYANGPQKLWVDTLIAGHPLEIARQDLERRNSAEAQPVLDAAIMAMRAMVDHAERARNLSLRDVALNALCAVVALAVAIAGLLIAERRISQPLLKLTRVMRALADRDTSIDIPGLQRRDEIGAMARAVVVFRDEIIRAGELTALAEIQEAEKTAQAAEATAQIEAMANAQGEVVETVVFGLMQLTEGNLAFTLSIPLAPEYEMLRELFNQAVTGLRSTVHDVLTHTAAIGSGAGELAGAADELAKRTQIQATSIEQAAAALDQITATIGQTASASLQAQSRAAGATEEAESSSQVVGETVAAMAAIDGSARRIGQIIGLIDEIALQTNLLALNAAIEAANAGPAGQGFALVAAEVRLLAQRAAVAAKEIKAMVVASTRHVSRGVQLVDETGAAIGRIIAGVSEINAAITLIAAAAREQASGIAEVNTTFNQMDQVTQANAAMVEQSTAAVHALAAETAELNGAMARFTLDAA